MADIINGKFEAPAINTPTPNDNLNQYIMPEAPSQTATPTETPVSAAKDSAGAGTKSAGDSLEVTPIQTPGWNQGEAAKDGQEAQDGRPELHETRQNVVDAADRAVGTRPYLNSEFADRTQNGMLAGAANFSEILRASGEANVSAAHVRGPGGLEEQLTNQGWMQRPLEFAKPGDLVIQPIGEGSHSKIGMMGKDGSYYSHDRDGKVTKYRSFTGKSGYVLAPPETCNE